MKIYLLQIHEDKNEGEWDVFDELYHFEDFDSLCVEFQNKVQYYTAHDFLLSVIKNPFFDEDCNEVRGTFKFVDTTGCRVMARVADIDI